MRQHEAIDCFFEGSLILDRSLRDGFPVDQVLVEQGLQLFVVDSTHAVEVFIQRVVEEAVLVLLVMDAALDFGLERLKSLC